MSKFGRIPDDAAYCIKASDFADDIDRKSDKQSADDACARSSICPEQDSFFNV